MDLFEPNRRRCQLSARLANLSEPVDPAVATITALGGDGAALTADLDLAPETQVALDFRIPIWTEEINVIAKVRDGSQADGYMCDFVHIPLFVRNMILVWLDGGPPETPAARLSARGA